VTGNKKPATEGVKRICNDLLGYHKVANYQDVVQDLLTSVKAMGCNMSLKMHFLESYLDSFSPKISVKSAKNTVKDFTKTLRLWKRRTNANEPLSMLADYCWAVKWDVPDVKYW
jgi:hypothetical protein